MRIKSRNHSGSALVATVVIMAIFGITLAGYLSYLRQQNHMVHRSVSWNSTVQLAEAGVEEVLAQLNENGDVIANNGFEIVQGKYIMKSRDLKYGSYKVGFSMATNPVIIAQGVAPVPLSDVKVTRTVKVQTSRKPLFSAALVADEGIDLKGNDITIDSFDSTIPEYNTDGQYDPAKRRDKAAVATNSSLKDSINIGNANIYGEVLTGAGGTVYSGPNGIIGDQAWHNTHTKGVDPNAISDDFNLELGSVLAPFSSAFPPIPGLVDGILYDYVLNAGDYKISSPLKLKGKVLVRGATRLLVSLDSSVAMSGTDEITIAPSGSLELYCATPNVDIGGQGVVNQSGNAANFIIFGLPTCTSMKIGGNGEFIGSVYAPQTALTLSGGGSSEMDFCGAIVAKSAVFNGTYKLHYDESLARGRYRGFIAISWEEIGTDWDKILAQNLELKSVE